jgi:hypothetical protein
MAILRAFCGQKSKCHVNNAIARRSNSGWWRADSDFNPASEAGHRSEINPATFC